MKHCPDTACRASQPQPVVRRSAPSTRFGTHEAPPIVHDVLQSPGRPLDAGTRGFMEDRFQHDFSGVRVHTDGPADASAFEIDAEAYTVGRNVVFASGRYAPHTGSGAALLAHELAHVVQQSGGTGGAIAAASRGGLQLGAPGDALEQEADRAAHRVMRSGGPVLEPVTRGHAPSAGVVQRRLVVNPGDTIPATPPRTPTRLTTAVQGLLADTCPDGQFVVDMMTGAVTSRLTRFCEDPRPPIPFLSPDASSTPVGCQCLCDAVNNAQTTTIAFRAGGPTTGPGSVPGAGPGQGGVRTNATVNVDPRFQGQYLIDGRWVDVPFHLLFSHELCGHALPKMRGTHAPRAPHPPGGTGPSERRAVDVERDIAAEHNPPLPRRPEDYSGGAQERPRP